jgi:His/Glu/Gln/Arg/opine family amino acid ABC transporter permease subunit
MYQFLSEKLGLRFLPVVQNLDYLIEGLYLTNLITGLSFLSVCSVGLALALAKISRIRTVSFFATAYIEFFRSIPLLVSIFGIYYILPALNLNLSAIVCGVISLSLSCSCFMAENYRSGIQSVDQGQIEAARSIGLSPFQTYRKIIFPQALRVITPLAMNLLSGMLRWSSLISVIGVQELVFRAEYKVSILYLPLEFFSSIAIYYIIVCGSLNRIATRLEVKWRRKYHGAAH